MTNFENSDGELGLDYSIIDPKMTVKAMRDSGYKSTTHALAELIDNSIESGASTIEIFGLSRINESTQTKRLQELAVLDNGQGMNRQTLRSALRYGHGTRHERRGIGRFGMGLPNSSMSQARRLDIWSWQSGATNALHTYLSLDEVESGVTLIPEPQLQKLPEAYLQCTRMLYGNSGTLVVWSELDRVEWRRASTTFKHTEFLLGRIYRRFLATDTDRLHVEDTRNEEIGPRRKINLIPIDEEDEGEFVVRDEDIVEVRPNDPLYLMNGTSCPEQFGNGPMFTELPEFSPTSIAVDYGGRNFEVQIRASYVRPLARDFKQEGAAWPEQLQGLDAGNSPWGKHAAQNLGVSLMRAHREIQLDESWTSPSEPRDRWWSIEVDFPTELDEVFGITNNKQGAVTFQRLATFDWRREVLEDEQSKGDVRRRMEADGDPRVFLQRVHEHIDRCRSTMRARIRQYRITRHRQDDSYDEETIADKKASDVIKKREQDGYRGDSDKAAESGTEQEHREEQVRSLTEKHRLDPDDALRKVEETLKTDSRVRWIQSDQQSPAFFDVEPLPSVIQVALNRNHPVHSHLWEVMHPDMLDDDSVEQLQEQLSKAASAFRILVYSWARYEEEQTGRDRKNVRDARIEWGRYAEEFFDDPEDELGPTDLV